MKAIVLQFLSLLRSSLERRKKNVGRQVSFFLIFFFAIVFVAACNQNKEPEYQKEYRQRILLQYLLLPQGNPNAACLTATQRFASCMSNVQSLPFPATEPFLAGFYLQLISPNADVTSIRTYASACTQAQTAQLFRTASDRAKECIFNCQSSVLQTLQAGGSCNAPFSSLSQQNTGLFSQFFTRVSSCAANSCFSVINTPNP